jgi:hypothetical protein
MRHAYDVHWQISNSALFATLWSFEELVSQAVPVPALHVHARTLAPVHALLLACLHRVAHHHNSQRLIWLYDLHLLAQSLTCAEQGEFVRLAGHKHVRAICRHGLELAQHCFATPVAADLLAALRLPDDHATWEATARFLSPHQRRWQLLRADLHALPGWLNKVRLLQEHVLPPATYLLTHYGTTRRALLPVLYLHRALRGFWRLWQRAEC